MKSDEEKKEEGEDDDDRGEEERCRDARRGEIKGGEREEEEAYD